MTFRNDRKELRKGEKLLVTVEEVCHNTLLVTLEYRKAKFSGVLLNATNRRGPYGIEELPVDSYYRSYGIDPAKLKAEDGSEVAKAQRVPPPLFPETIETRTTYAQKVEHPPARQIFQRRRRSKRKVRMDMMDTDLALKLMNTSYNRKMLSHPPSCNCDFCTAGKKVDQDLTDDKPLKVSGKRKLVPNLKKPTGKEEEDEEWQEKLKHLSNGSKKMKLEKKVVVEPPKSEELKAEDSHGLKRSPVIKISYKSPGGKGRVLKIPSRIHSTPPKDSQKNALHERARKAVMRAKNEQYKHAKEHKDNARHNQQDFKFKISSTENGGKKTVSVKAQKAAASRKEQKPKGNPGSKVAENKKLSKGCKRTEVGFLLPPKKAEVSERAVSLRRKSSSPRKLTLASVAPSVPVSSIAPVKKTVIENPLKKDKSPRFESKQDPAKTVAESANAQKKRQLRTTPQVLLQPLQSGKNDEWSEGGQASGKGHHATAKSLHDDSDDDISIASTSSASGKKKDTGLSHSLTVTRCTTKEGVQWCQGDVVWAKIMGFPWWPGIIRTIVVKMDGSTMEQIAIVDWFRSKTVSHIPCSALEPFSGNFKKRFSKKVKGNYKKAIEDAREAEKKMSPEVRKLIVQFETT